MNSIRVSAAVVPSQDHIADQLCCRDMSWGRRKCLLKGAILGKGKITECSVKPAQKESVGSLSRGQIINWCESSMGVLASVYAFFKTAYFLWVGTNSILTFQFCSFLWPCFLSRVLFSWYFFICFFLLLSDSSAWKCLTLLNLTYVRVCCPWWECTFNPMWLSPCLLSTLVTGNI